MSLYEAYCLLVFLVIKLPLLCSSHTGISKLNVKGYCSSIFFFKEINTLLLFRKEALNRSKVTEKIFIMLQPFPI